MEEEHHPGADFGQGGAEAPELPGEIPVPHDGSHIDLAEEAAEAMTRLDEQRQWMEKPQGSIPTYNVDKAKVETIIKNSLKEGRATYFSRSRGELWTKGETSGNTQELLAARFDCDRDTILFKVNQKGNACHLNRFSCFEDREFCINELYDLILDRKVKLPENSYTTKLFKDEFYLKRKIMEEAFESVNFELGDGLSWEAADLAYHMLVFMALHNVSIEDIINNLSSRTK